VGYKLTREVPESRHHGEDKSLSAGEEDDSGTAQRFAFGAVRDTLGASSDVDSCVALASRIDALMNEALEFFEKDGAGIACRAGCNFCCHLRVMVYPHEAIALFRYLNSQIPKEQADGVRERLIENAARIGKLDREGGGSTRIACAFLVDGKCSAYEVRPAACSGYHSLSREKCEEGYNNPSGSRDGIPVLKALRYVAAAVDDGMDEALAEAGLGGARVELQTAVAALIRNPALIGRWRSGRELLKK
jgi:Fe-S-cluster containining protein